MSFRALHTELFVLPNAWDPLSARLFAESGAKAVATSSAALAWAHGAADGERLPVELLVSSVALVLRGLAVPLSVDLERGYSDDPTAVRELVARLGDLGVAGVNLEDGKGAPELLARKLEACRDTGVFLNARTDVLLRQLGSVDEAARRGRLYESAGADGFFVPRAATVADLADLAAATRLPLNVFVVPELPQPSELAALGVKRLSTGPKLAFVAYEAARRACVALLDGGTYPATKLTVPEVDARFS